MAVLSRLSLIPLFVAAAPAVGARVEVYDAGTFTPRTVYQDAESTVPHAWPIVVPASGRIPPFFTAGEAYKVRLLTKSGVALEEIDGIVDAATTSGGGGGGGGTSDLITGDVVWSYRTGTRANFVRLNGRTIGSALSGASELTGDAAFDLYVHLWAVDPSLAVAGGRGASAAADWAANKTLTLPDARFRTLRGLDDMGAAPAGRAAGVDFPAGSATTLGSACGSATVSLTAAQLAAHSHTGSTASVAGHSHTGATYAAGAHAHGATAGSSGTHGHVASTGASGTHGHTGATYGAGGHAHTGATSGAGDHVHTVNYQLASTFRTDQASGAVNAIGSERVSNSLATSNGAGAHAHSFTTDAVGDHAHALYTDPGGDHVHTVTVNAGGDHVHAITVLGVGDHAHGFATDTAGAHGHTFTTDLTGTGAAHANVSPSLVGTFYMRL